MWEFLDKFGLRENTRKALIMNLLLIGFAGFLLLSLFFYVYLPVTTNHGDTITVPDLTGMKVGELEAFLNEKDLRFVVDDSSYKEGVPPQTVLSQDPLPFSKVKINRRIHITVNSSTPPLERVPEIIDSSIKQAIQMLEGVGFKIGQTKFVPDVAANAIIRVSHKGKFLSREEIRNGIMLPKGSVIDVEVGDGMGQDAFDLPNVVGKTAEEAEITLKGSGLGVSIQYESGSGQTAGSVIRQKPAYYAGKTIKIGEVVEIWVAKD